MTQPEDLIAFQRKLDREDQRAGVTTRSEFMKLLYRPQPNMATCRARGPDHAVCVRERDHPGPHEGNGFDDYGSMYRLWKKANR